MTHRRDKNCASSSTRPRARVAVDGVSFSIREGEIFSLLGPNGAGKTTTISILSCLLKPDVGEADVGGFSWSDEPDEVKKLIGVVPQDIALYDDLSGRENLDVLGPDVRPARRRPSPSGWTRCSSSSGSSTGRRTGWTSTRAA